MDEFNPFLPSDPIPNMSALGAAGMAANQAAQLAVFRDYQLRRSQTTLRRQLADLRLFAGFLQEAGLKIEGEHLLGYPQAWRGLTWGILEAFKRWMLQKGYAVGSINVRLSTVKTYAGLAMKAGMIEVNEQALIRQVVGFSHSEAFRVDGQRRITRVGLKKAEAVRISPQDAAALISQPDTPQGRRDRLMMCLMLEHGLRVGEVAMLKVDSIDLRNRELRFFRPKVNKQQVHQLTPRTLAAARAYFRHGDAFEQGSLLRASYRGGDLARHAGMTERGITKRVRWLGKQLGLFGLSAHDCRHYWATRAARSGTDAFALQEAGGWNSLAMPRRYVEQSSVANINIKGFGKA